MRPDILYPLFVPSQSLPGVGSRNAKAISRLAGDRVVDLIWHLPTGFVDRSRHTTLSETPAGAIATLLVTVVEHRPASGRGRPTRVDTLSADGEALDLVFFHARGDYLVKTLPIGEQRVVSGRIDWYQGVAQMVHPDFIVPETQWAEVAVGAPTYSLTQGLTPRVLERIVRAALERAPMLPEWNDAALMKSRQWGNWHDSLQAAHTPKNDAEIEPSSSPRQRLAYDELLANQLALLIVRDHQRALKGRATKGDGHLRGKLLSALPFDLTASQQSAIEEIEADMARPTRMLRLLQGDVGSGKTVVAVIAMLIAVEMGAQAALMAPTEILARQHAATLESLLGSEGPSVTVLTGREKGKAREQRLQALADGRTAIAVGTHALFQDDVVFKDLAIAVIDEQHRFGVHQRLGLSGKGEAVDVLVMTATPIPRTLTLTAYGDMDVSRLIDKPAGRQPITTRVMPLERLSDVVEAVGRAIAGGSRAYWICPLVDESEVTDLAAVRERHADLAGHFGERVGLIHGRMKGAEKDAVMASFADGSIDVLVATTVVEVGVDVPEATIMIIEHAERFGLAQLHQLRGRVGRGRDASTCLLLYGTPLGETARARLSILRETEDGFRISEEDLRLRGAGEVLGTRQSGLPQFRIADLAAHADLLPVARDDARVILAIDPALDTPRGRALRVLLYLFERDAAVRTLRSG